MPQKDVSALQALDRIKSLGWLKRERIERLARSMSTFRVKRRATIFYEGEASSHVYVLLSGVAKLSLLNPDGRVLVWLIGPGEVFGVSSLLTEAHRPFRCDACTDCLVGAIKPDAFVEIVLGLRLSELSPALDVTVGRWWSMLLRYTSFVGLGLRERLAGALLEIAAKFGCEDSRGALLTLKLTHADLAELVGASRQRTTAQLSEFERERLIIRDGRRLIIVTERLRQTLTGPGAD